MNPALRLVELGGRQVGAGLDEVRYVIAHRDDSVRKAMQEANDLVSGIRFQRGGAGSGDFEHQLHFRIRRSKLCTGPHERLLEQSFEGLDLTSFDDQISLGLPRDCVAHVAAAQA